MAKNSDGFERRWTPSCTRPYTPTAVDRCLDLQQLQVSTLQLQVWNSGGHKSRPHTYCFRLSIKVAVHVQMYIRNHVRRT